MSCLLAVLVPVAWADIMANMVSTHLLIKSLVLARTCSPWERNFLRKCWIDLVFMKNTKQRIIFFLFFSIRGRYPPYSERKACILNFLLRKRRPFPKLYISHILAFGVGIGLTFLANHYLQVIKEFLFPVF